ncbi:MAG: DUF4375 domain-containing protein [Candidatus Hydrogenedentes bacterium]|nr:DUF4375 domain-containing protein [Candidatus Hydrogenedentota bacterium]
MPGTEWLDGYDGQTTDELIALEKDYRIDSIVLAFEQAVQEKEYECGPENLTDAERVIVAVEAIEREVNNGGYGQFFINSSNAYAPIAVSALNQIGCSATAAITQRAINALGALPDLSPETLEDRMNEDDPARDEALGKADEDYYSTGEAIADRLFDFIKQNRAQILSR